MVKHSFIQLPAPAPRGSALALATFFFLGHLLGLLTAGSAGDFFRSAMRTVVSSRVSIIGLLSSAVLPFLFSAFAAYLGRPFLLFPTAFWKAFLFSYMGSGLFAAWGSAGWLITLLVMFGSLCSMPVLYWYWLRCLSGRRFDVAVFCLLLGILVAVSLVHYYLMVPFLARIITF